MSGQAGQTLPTQVAAVPTQNQTAMGTPIITGETYLNTPSNNLSPSQQMLLNKFGNGGK